MKLRTSKITSATLHHSATSMTKTLQDIINIHKNRGFETVGYNYLIKFESPTSDKCSIKVGRDIKYKGAHCDAGNANETSLGICVIGDFTKNKLDDAQYNSLAGAIVHIMKKHNLKKLYYHKDWKATACPALDNKLRTIVDKKLEESK